VDAPSINAFKGRLDKLRQTRVGFLWINPLKPLAPRDDWLCCEATQGKAQGKIDLAVNLQLSDR